MTQINVAETVAPYIREERIGADDFLRKNSVALHAPVVRLLLAIAAIWKQGGGVLSSVVLDREYGLQLDDDELLDGIELLIQNKLLVEDGEDEFEVSPQGVRIAAELEWMRSRELTARK